MRPRFPRRKRLFDLVLVACSVPITVPALLVCALAIRLDSAGPVLYRQVRTGQDGRPFRMLKFRTMVANADQLKAQLQHLNVLQPPDFKIPDDPRITRVGRVLRATSLDELPQLWNVVRGEMSLVGPRPTSFAPHTYELWHTRRLEAKPGLTGLWQISGRHVVAFDDRLRLDDWYMRHASLWLDLSILVRTVPVVLRKAGA